MFARTHTHTPFLGLVSEATQIVAATIGSKIQETALGSPGTIRYIYVLLRTCSVNRPLAELALAREVRQRSLLEEESHV